MTNCLPTNDAQIIDQPPQALAFNTDPRKKGLGVTRPRARRPRRVASNDQGRIRGLARALGPLPEKRREALTARTEAWSLTSGSEYCAGLGLVALK